MPDRIILINKPLRWTSFDVVKKLKKPLLEEKKRHALPEERATLKKIKVGHAGTLDPLATGLLVICSGKLTKVINEIQDAEKEYTGTITFGAVTESFDLEKPPVDFRNTDHLSEQLILETAKTFLGEQIQTPPVHSAKKINGQRAYEKARRGEEFEMKPKSITIYSFEITSFRIPEIDFRICCSKGTYIRSIAHDFGVKVETGAYLSTLCRTRIGKYKLEDALSPEEFLMQLTQQQPL
jgi:tRNA pseudouridine55 synthase